MSFADDYFDDFGALGTSQVRMGDTVVEPYRDGDAVFLNHEGQKYRVISVHGYWNNAIVELVLVEDA